MPNGTLIANSQVQLPSSSKPDATLGPMVILIATTIAGRARLAIAVDSEEIATEATIAAIAQRRCCCGRPSTIRGVSIALVLSCMCPGDPAAGGAPDHRLLFILCSVRSLQWPIRM